MKLPRVDLMGSKSKLTSLIVFFVVVAILCVIYFYPFILPGKPEKVTIDIISILDNPNEYNNPIYLKTLSDEEKTQVIDSLNNLLYENCKDGKLNEKCTPYFLYSYLKIRTTLGEFGYVPEDPEEEYENVIENIIKNIYFDLYSNFIILTEDDLKGFVVPLLTEICRIRIFNGTEIIYWVSETEKIDWMQKLLDVNKTNWQSTDIQIFYLQSCMQVLNITQLSRITGMDLEELNSKICNIIPNLKDINVEDACYVTDYVNMKRFCEVNITTEDKAIVEDLVSKEYESSYQKDCKNQLYRLYILI